MLSFKKRMELLDKALLEETPESLFEKLSGYDLAGCHREEKVMKLQNSLNEAVEEMVLKCLEKELGHSLSVEDALEYCKIHGGDYILVNIRNGSVCQFRKGLKILGEAEVFKDQCSFSVSYKVFNEEDWLV